MSHNAPQRDLFRSCSSLFLCLVFLFAGVHAVSASEEQTKISMWVYPIGDFSKPETVEKFIAAFHEKHPETAVSVEYLDYRTGDIQVSAALAAGTFPDIVMEGPERIVANWGAKGVMVDLSDLWDRETIRDISRAGDFVVTACKSRDTAFYVYPLCKTAHCMAINYEVFKKAGALQYIDQRNRTWSDQGFEKACKAIAHSRLVKSPAVVYCGGQGGDQGTRALVTNLYGADFTSPDHTRYTVNTVPGIRALEKLSEMASDGELTCSADLQGVDDLALFRSGTTAMTFAWNSSNEENYASEVNFTPFAMTFPTNQPVPRLSAGIWGFGIFNSGDARRIEAAKTFIRFLCDDPTQGRQSVRATKFFPVRASMGDVYRGTPDEAEMKVYQDLLRYAGDYYNTTPEWSAQRTAWWNMLQQVCSGTAPQKAADWYTAVCNQALGRTPQGPISGIFSESTQRILFISSFSLNDPTVKEQIEGLQAGLKSNVNIHFEFMDSMAISDARYVASFYKYIVEKYEHFNGLGAIIVGDDNALQMVIRYQNGFFRNIPVIYESINSQVLIELANSLGMTGVPAESTIVKNIDFAHAVFKNATKLVAISDDSAVGTVLTAQLKAVKSRYKDLQIDSINTSDCKIDELCAKIENSGPDAVILYMSFTSDADGKSYPYREALRIVTEHAKGPVFTLTWLGCGTLGGFANNSWEIGKRSGEIANRFFSQPSANPSPGAVAALPILATFDASVMERFDLSKSQFPKNTRYVNDTSRTERLLVIIALLSAGLIGLFLVLLYLKKENRRRRKSESHLRKLSENLKAEAEVDSLTKLGNRRLFDREFSRCVSAQRSFVVFIIDLDNFKNINDSYGHSFGDYVLRETGNRLNAFKSRVFVPYRYGGDEFVVMYFVEGSSLSRVSVEEEIFEKFRQKFKFDGKKTSITLSIGSAVFPRDATTAERLFDCADQALYAAKCNGKNSYRRFGALKK